MSRQPDVGIHTKGYALSSHRAASGTGTSGSQIPGQ